MNDGRSAVMTAEAQGADSAQAIMPAPSFLVRVYLAGAYLRRAEINSYAQRLCDAAVTVVSCWHKGEQLGPGLDNGYCPPIPGEGEIWARQDLRELRLADLVLNFTDGVPARGGRHVEFGFALALGKALWLVGPREHCFHCLTGVRQFDNFEQVLPVLRR